MSGWLRKSSVGSCLVASGLALIMGESAWGQSLSITPVKEPAGVPVYRPSKTPTAVNPFSAKYQQYHRAKQGLPAAPDQGTLPAPLSVSEVEAMNLAPVPTETARRGVPATRSLPAASIPTRGMPARSVPKRAMPSLPASAAPSPVTPALDKLPLQEGQVIVLDEKGNIVESYIEGKDGKKIPVDTRKLVPGTRPATQPTPRPTEKKPGLFSRIFRRAPWSSPKSDEAASEPVMETETVPAETPSRSGWFRKAKPAEDPTVSWKPHGSTPVTLPPDAVVIDAETVQGSSKGISVESSHDRIPAVGGRETKLRK